MRFTYTHFRQWIQETKSTSATKLSTRAEIRKWVLHVRTGFMSQRVKGCIVAVDCCADERGTAQLATPDCRSKSAIGHHLKDNLLPKILVRYLLLLLAHLNLFN